MIGPTAAERLLHDAAVCQASGDGARARALLTRLLEQEPDNPWAAVRLADLAIERHESDTAIAALQAVLRQQPNFAPALSALGEALWLAGRPAEGLEHARRAVAIQPPHPQFRLVRGQLATWLGHYAEARAQLDPLLEERYGALPVRVRADAFTRLAEWHIAQGQFAQADPAFRQALALVPDAPVTHMAYGMNLLRQGRFDPGWREYEWRLLVGFLQPRHAPLPPDGRAGAPWAGEDLRGRTLLLYDDQGFGDAIQLFRYLPLVRRRGPARIMLRTYPALVRLFAPAAPFAAVVDAVPAEFTADLHCATSSLPLLFGTRLDSIPGPAAYLRPPESGGPLLRHSGGLQVGLAWSGDRQHLRDHLRSIPAEQFLQLATVPGIGLHSLQREVRPADAAALAAYPQVSRVGERLRDWADTAAVVAQLDLVVTVDTGIAHLAGAMGKPVWVLLSRSADWRWLTRRTDSPWYPSLRLFRAGTDGWRPVLRRVKHALAVRAAG